MESPKMLLHPLAGTNPANWLRLLRDNEGVDSPYWLSGLKITGSTLFELPFKLFEDIRFGREIEQVDIQEPPIFILGHWRSGTTYFHRMMCLDATFGHLSNFQAFLPEVYLSGRQFWQPIFKMTMPKKRPMDNMDYRFGSPEEEEYALGNISPYSFYHCMYFPRHMRAIFDKSLLFEGLSKSEIDSWKQSFLKVLKKLTLDVGNRPLLLKNPANTSRIDVLLELFPDAKFIHIYRDPYAVFSSTQRFYERMLPHYALQRFTEQEVEENILLFYQKLMRRFFETKDLIPKKNFLEIRYEDFVGNEVAVLKQVYSQFRLPGFQAAEPLFLQSASSAKSYRGNRYEIEAATREKVTAHWGFSIERWKHSEFLPAATSPPL